MADASKSKRASMKPPAIKTKVSSKSTRIGSPRDKPEIYQDSDETDDEPPVPLPRSHTPGQLAGKSPKDRRRPAEIPIRNRSQSATQALPSRPSTSSGAKIPPPLTESPERIEDKENRSRPLPRTTSVITNRAMAVATISASRKSSVIEQASASGEHRPFPLLPDPKKAPQVAHAPASGMYWSKAPTSGAPHSCLRAHTTTLIGSNVYIFGGCDSNACFNTLYVLDADAFYWSVPLVVGEVPAPLRAMTCTAVGKKLVVFGGGDGPAYYNDIYVLDTINFRWSKPKILGDKFPSKRRAHTACLYKNGIYVFGGGDGIRALNDIWRLDVSDVNKMSWKLVYDPSGDADEDEPKARGYHTANMVGSKLIIYGGSDGGECFDDVWVYDVDTHVWKEVDLPVTFRRLSHTATIVGSYLFVIGGHDGNDYCNDLLLLNLVTMTWDKRKVYGQPPSGRGYHGTVLHDSRVLMIGGFDGNQVFGDVTILELAVHAYYSQISHFTIEV